MQTADKVMTRMLVTFNERKARYGLNYLMIGKVMASLFPDGITLKTEEDWNKMHLFLMMMVKATRLANTNLTHEDSAHDASVYSAMLNGLLLPNDEDLPQSEEPISIGGLKLCCMTKEDAMHDPMCVFYPKEMAFHGCCHAPVYAPHEPWCNNSEAPI